MSDALPTISADQLTKAVSLAAAGTLSALEAEAENEAVDEPQNSGKSTSMNSFSCICLLLFECRTERWKVYKLQTENMC